MTEDIVYVVIAEKLPEFTQVFLSHKEATEYCEGWHPITMRIMPALRNEEGHLTPASLN